MNTAPSAPSTAGQGKLGRPSLGSSPAASLTRWSRLTSPQGTSHRPNRRSSVSRAAASASTVAAGIGAGPPSSSGTSRRHRLKTVIVPPASVSYRDAAVSAPLARIVGGCSRSSFGTESRPGRGGIGKRPATVQQVVEERNEQSGSRSGATEEDWRGALHPHSRTIPNVLGEIERGGVILCPSIGSVVATAGDHASALTNLHGRNSGHIRPAQKARPSDAAFSVLLGS